MEVLLSNGLRGIVSKNYSDFMTRPRIKLLPIKGKEPSEEYLELKSDPALLNVTILKVLN